MKLLFDQNISYKILKLILDDFPESTTIKNCNLIDQSDKVIWDFAKANNFTIVTQDSDFNDFNLLYGFPPKIIWIRLGNIQTSTLSQVLIAHKKEIHDFKENSNYGCFEIIVFKN